MSELKTVPTITTWYGKPVRMMLPDDVEAMASVLNAEINSLSRRCDDYSRDMMRQALEIGHLRGELEIAKRAPPPPPAWMRGRRWRFWW